MSDEVVQHRPHPLQAGRRRAQGAEYQGVVLPGDEALRRAGTTPLVLSGKDGLALISANEEAITVADPRSDAVHRAARPIPGQAGG
jgi:histidine ammonia-lyase